MSRIIFAMDRDDLDDIFPTDIDDDAAAAAADLAAPAALNMAVPPPAAAFSVAIPPLTSIPTLQQRTGESHPKNPKAPLKTANTPIETHEEPKKIYSRQSSARPALVRRIDSHMALLKVDYPYAAHFQFLGMAGEEDDDDPYANLVVWARMPGHQPWPSRLASDGERMTLGKPAAATALQAAAAPAGGVSAPSNLPILPIQEIGAGVGTPQDNLCMYFFGSQQVGMIRRSNLEPYIKRYKENCKCTQKHFLLGLEEADAYAMQAKLPDGTSKCMCCGQSQDPDSIILCDRCNSEVHMQCLNPPMIEIPEDDWYCPICVLEAPASMEFVEIIKKQFEKRRSKSGTSGGGSGKRLRLAGATPGSENGPEKSIHAPLRGAPNGIRWTDEEDRMLIQSRDGNKKWEEVVEILKERSANACKTRFAFLQRNGIWNGTKPPVVAQVGVSAAASPPSSSVAAVAAAVPAPPPKRVAAIKAANVISSVSSTGQISAMVKEAVNQQRATTTSKLFAKNYYCFVCNQEGATVTCDVDGCTRVFHAFCLGAAAPLTDSDGFVRGGKRGGDDENDESDAAAVDSAIPWTCPWHQCALCVVANEGQPASAAVVGKTSSSLLKKRLSALMAVEVALTNSFTVNEPPALSVLRKAQIGGGSGSMSIETLIGEGVTTTTTTSTTQLGEVAANPAPTMSSPDASSILYRCRSCPLALCSKHLDAPSNCCSNLGLRRHVNGFFACERCPGVATNGDESKPSSLIMLNNHLNKTISQVARCFDGIVGPFLHSPSRELVENLLGQFGVDAFFTVHRNTVLSLGDLQAKVRRLSYASLDAFKQDYENMSDALRVLFERPHPRIAEVAISLRTFFSNALLPRLFDISQAEQDLRKAAGLAFFAKTTIALSLVGLTPWETLERTKSLSKRDRIPHMVSKWNLNVDNAKKRTKSSETLAVLFQALDAAQLLPKSQESDASSEEQLMAPPRERLEALLENHSLILRNALKSAAEIRHQIAKVLDVVDVVNSQNGDFFEPVLTLGGNRIEAEMQVANRGLQAKLAETKDALALERRARESLEGEVKKLRESAAAKAASTSSMN